MDNDAVGAAQPRRAAHVGGAFTRGRECSDLSVQLIAQGIVRTREGFFYYSPGSILIEAKALQEAGPLPAEFGDVIAAVIGRLTERALKAEKGDG